MQLRHDAERELEPELQNFRQISLRSSKIAPSFGSHCRTRLVIVFLGEATFVCRKILQVLAGEEFKICVSWQRLGRHGERSGVVLRVVVSGFGKLIEGGVPSFMSDGLCAGFCLYTTPNNS